LRRQRERLGGPRLEALSEGGVFGEGATSPSAKGSGPWGVL